MDNYRVYLTKQAERDLLRLPMHIAIKLQAWVDDVEYRGLHEVRKIPYKNIGDQQA